ncbi:uncharacterized protein LOC115884078 isoform X14 [Sitophilus oryzae]|uniref:Uncharacterized protein LOC115884078 isoform X14 n=1 Tax=Sitophilus oryzae TaxID=7048 RepID=A0A6J2Y5V3_SITOR|nr:uncharacterized protein LOC115884078 isoform X14 [Sitophilus oryzae]
MADTIVCMITALLYFLCYIVYSIYRRGHTDKISVQAQQQEQNVYSISGRVQGQEQQQRFPEAFVSVEHISIMNEMNKPPKYDDAPPSYEEAIKIAMAQNNSMETLRAEQAGVHQASSSSSVTVVQPAVPNRTTE